MISGLRYVALLIVLTAVVAGGLVAYTTFGPERSTTVHDDLPADAVPIKSGDFVGQADHEVSGSVTLFRTTDGYGLFFENYHQTQGPAVYVYLTPSSHPDTKAEIEAGRRVRITGGADGGESTKEGTFTVRLPDDIDPAAYDGVAIWGTKFDTPFGFAPLEPVPSPTPDDGGT